MEPKEYVKLMKKYKKLPSWSWVEKNFFFKPEEAPILEQIKRSMFEKFESVCEDMESLLSVGENLESFYERKMLTPQERDGLFEVYKKIKSVLWACNKISIDYSEKQHADWIVSTKEQWEKLKPDIAKFCEKLSEGWKTYKKPETDTSYHG
ncbi:hypothetical protein D4Q76_01890 [archaeon]|nr:MAG: hypothetical protein D4Q76_01890 [archaeon]